MPFVDIQTLPVVERLPGWRGRYFDSPSMTFAHYEFDAGASIHEHRHPQEEVWQILDGEVETTIDGAAQRAIIPPNVWHFVKACSDGKAIVVDYPLREESFRKPHPVQNDV